MSEEIEKDNFLQFCAKERAKFEGYLNRNDMHPDFRDASDRILRVFDELRAQLRKPLYKPYLGGKLEFPAEWAGISITLSAGACGWNAWKDVQALTDYANSGFTTEAYTKYVFYHWDEVQQALKGVEAENRQLHVMADLISWHLVGPGGVKINNSQIELF